MIRAPMPTPARIRWLLPVTAWLAGSLCVWLFGGAAVTGPTIFPDETCYLGWARHLSDGAFYSMGGAGYCHLLYPLLMAPFQLLHDPGTQYRAIMALNALLCGACLPIARYVGIRHLAMTTAQGWCAGILAICYPAMLAYSGSAWPESLLYPLALIWLSTWCRFCEQRSTAALTAFAATTLALYAAHPRMIALLGVLLPALAWYGSAKERPRQRAVAWAIAFGVVAVFWGLDALKSHALSLAWTSGSVEPIGRMVHLFTDFPPDVLAKFSGQMLFALIASLGFAWLPLIHQLRKFVPLGRSSPAGVGNIEPLNLVAAPAALLLVAGLGAVFLSGPGVSDRFDMFFYGRHAGPFVALNTLVGFAIASRMDPKSARFWLVLGAVLCVLVSGLLGASGPGADYSRIHVAGLQAVFDWLRPLAGTPAFLAGLCVVAAGAVIACSLVLSRSYRMQFFVIWLGFIAMLWAGHASAPLATSNIPLTDAVKRALGAEPCRILWSPTIHDRVQNHQAYRLQYMYPDCGFEFLGTLDCDALAPGMLVTTRKAGECAAGAVHTYPLPHDLILHVRPTEVQ